MTIANERELSTLLLTDFPSTSRVLVVAPHPDDEIFGCGGALSLLNKKGLPIRTVVVTDGAMGGSPNNLDLAQIRVEESCAAAYLLGLEKPLFWGLPDRGVKYGEILIERLQQSIVEANADLVFLPSPTDWHPDHQTIAFAGAEAIRRLGGKRHAAFYEVTDPLPSPNLICNISAVVQMKFQAMHCFKSQLQEEPYDIRISGINSFRAFHLGADVTSAEAFAVFTASDFEKGLAVLLEGQRKNRKHFGFACSGDDVPLVSIVVRSMDRPTLTDALNSLALQTYSNIEVVLVNAKGSVHQGVDYYADRFPIKQIENGSPIARSRAANLGLDAAQGQFIMFLDDDDWVDADHIEKLVHAIQRNASFKVAYTGVRCVDENNAPLSHRFDAPFDVVRLMADNFIPIHAALFSSDFLIRGCRVDESLDLYEDWDFWLQLLRHGAFLRVDGLSAVYRIGRESGFGVNNDPAVVERARSIIYNKWFSHLGEEQILSLMKAIRGNARNKAEMLDAQRLLARRDDEIANLHIEYENSNLARDNQIAALNSKVFKLDQLVAERDARIADLANSHSWKITKPLRFISRLLRGERPLVGGGLRERLKPYGRQIYWLLPPQYRTPIVHWSYRHFGQLFTGMAHYEQWKNAATVTTALLCENNHLLNIETQLPVSHADGSVAIHLHMYYHDLANEFRDYLKNMPFAYDLYISVVDEAAAQFCKDVFSNLPKQRLLVVEPVQNRGRDIAPMFCNFASRLKEYSYIAHLHSKKSLYNDGATHGWRQYLANNLLGSEQRIRQIFSLMQGDAPRGIVYPQNYALLPYAANTWLANRETGTRWCARLGIQPVPRGYFDFPAGSMFWAKGVALKPLFECGITIDDFADEEGQTDGTFAHCLERLLGLCTLKQGFRPGIIRDASRPGWSAWSFEPYAARSFENLVKQLTASRTKLIAFDIFDTLLIRPLMDAESIKTIVAEHVGESAGKLFLAYRAIAESQARQTAGRDIGMAEIYAQLAKLTGLDSEKIEQLRDTEETIERLSLRARSETVALYGQALASGKPVVLISDMFLPRAIIERSLSDNGIGGWNALFLSSEVGLRKDTGELYDHVLSFYSITAAEMLMVGDNERSDLQIPCDLGATTLHLLKPLEFARSLPRLRTLIEDSEWQGDINRELSLGLVLQHNFSPISYPQLDPESLFGKCTPFTIGYSVIGPLLVGFAHWLLENARKQGVERLYFLAREGQLVKQVYDVWSKGLRDLPQTEYLVVSRRAVSVPAIDCFQEILNIAEATYSSNTTSNFLWERFGLELTADQWSELTAKLNWHSSKQVEVHNRQIQELVPLLKALELNILANARNELQALNAYLKFMRVEEPGVQAVVDVGYGGTIQNYLNKVTSRPVHGFYLITDERSEKVREKHGVFLQGCYLEGIAQNETAPLMYLRSFELEKLLSSNDSQIVHYELDSSNNLRASHRKDSIDEAGCIKFRKELQEGVMQYAFDAKHIRDNILPNFAPSCAVGKDLYCAFVGQLSARENSLLREVTLDDFYCGRGVVA